MIGSRIAFSYLPFAHTARCTASSEALRECASALESGVELRPLGLKNMNNRFLWRLAGALGAGRSTAVPPPELSGRDRPRPMSTGKFLKHQNRPKIRSFVLLQLVVLSVVLFSSELLWVFSQETAPSQATLPSLVVRVVITPLLPIFSSFLADLLPSSFKDVLVFWRVRHVLPGHRAFSKIERDPRIDVHALRRKVGLLPVEPTEQNREWYRLLKSTESDPAVRGSHQDFLLWRDICSVSFLLILVGVPVSFAFAPSLVGIVYFGSLLTLFVSLATVAQVRGRRLVSTVLATAAST